MWFKFKKSKIEYKVVSQPTVEMLETFVGHYLSEGWKLQGGVCVQIVKTGGNQYDHVQKENFFQSLVRGG